MHTVIKQALHIVQITPRTQTETGICASVNLTSTVHKSNLTDASLPQHCYSIWLVTQKSVVIHSEPHLQSSYRTRDRVTIDD
jgi:hypothetical protein